MKALQIGQESQMVRMIDVMNNARQVEQERNLVVEDWRQMIEQLQAKETEREILTEHHFEISNQMMIVNWEINRLNGELSRKLEDFGVLREENEKLRNEVKIQL